MPHINHRRGETRRSVHRYPWDLRGRKVPGFRYFRRVERTALEKLRAGDDPDEILFPYRRRENDDPWGYD